MMNDASNPLASWLWKDLYVWPQGNLARSAYLGAMLRVLIIYMIFAQLLAAFSPTLLNDFNSREPIDMFTGVMWGQIGAIVLIAFPVWSVFQRRFNDMRPDLREKLKPWSTGFPLILIGLIGLMLANALGFQSPVDSADFGQVRFWFVAMLFGSAFVPGSDSVSVVKPVPDRFQTAAQMATHEAIAAQIGAKSAGRHLPTADRDRPKPASAPAFPPVIMRTRNLPQDGRVKPGWFS